MPGKLPHEWRGWHLWVHENIDQYRGIVTACQIKDGYITFYTGMGEFTFHDLEEEQSDGTFKFEGDFGRYTVLWPTL